MVRITVSELETDVRKFVAMAESQDVFVTEGGKEVVKLVKAERMEEGTAAPYIIPARTKEERQKALRELRQLFKGVHMTDGEIEQAREERLTANHSSNGGQGIGEEALQHFFSLYPKQGLELSPDKLREERLSR